VHDRIDLMHNVVYEETLLWDYMHLLNGSMKSYVHNMQLFKTKYFFKINAI
jgi:hypothetical protein